MSPTEQALRAALAAEVEGVRAALANAELPPGLHAPQQAPATSFRSLLDRIPDGVGVGHHGRFVYANRALLDLVGHASFAELARASLSDHLDADAIARVEAAVQSARAGGSGLPLQLEATRVDGERVAVELLVRSITWEGHAMTLGIARDLSEGLRLEARLDDADRMASVGTLAAGVAHEINNPLAYVMLNLEYMMHELPRHRDDPGFLTKLDARLTDAEHGARRVGQIVRELHSFAMRETPDGEPVSLRETLLRAVEISRPQVAPRAQLVTELEDVGTIRGDPGRLEQVFVNLLVNAAQAVPTGAPERNTVSLRVERSGETVVVEVADTGAGIPGDRVERVFDPFFTTKPAGIGTGLGLSLSHRIIRDLGGKIDVESEVGRGTVFRVSLPIGDAPARPPQSSRAPGPAAAPPKRARVLVIDDEPLVAEMFSKILRDDHDVTKALGGLEALHMIMEDDQRFDVIFCDLLMPDMDGMALYERLLVDHRELTERMVFMSAGAFTQRATQFLERVPNARIAKPFDLAEVERLVADFTGARDA